MKKDLAYYQRLPFWFRTRYERDGDGDGYWVAWVDELPGCEIDDPRRAEAIRKCRELFDDYIRIHIDEKMSITRPRSARMEDPARFYYRRYESPVTAQVAQTNSEKRLTRGVHTDSQPTFA
jgi:hypothetical protein